MLKCTLGCGFTTPNNDERFCPDCGAALTSEDGASGAATVEAVAAEAQPAAMPAIPEILVDTRPVVKTVMLPDKVEIHLREGDHFVIRRKRTDEEVAEKGVDEAADYYVPADMDGAVSASSALTLTIENGLLLVEGGGGNGYKISRVSSYKHDEKTAVHTVAGETATIVLGAKTPLRIK